MTSADTEAAIAAALSLDWSKALELNNKILNTCPDDIDCLNRIGKAYLELGDYKKAALFFRKVLKISKYDQIASRNLARVTQASAPKKTALNSSKNSGPHLLTSFLEEPGKTKIINLVNLAPIRTLLSLDNADPVLLISKRHTIFIENEDGNYLGAIPDDLAHRLLVLIKGGNKYEGFVKSCSKNTLTVFLKELSRAKKFHNTPSFPASGNDYLSFIREDPTMDESKQPGSSGQIAVDEIDAEDAGFSKNNIHQDEEEEES